MKSPRVLIALSVLLLTVGWRTWDRFHTYPATSETESAFLNNYTPKNVLNRFNAESYSNGRSASAGHDSVTHTANFHGYFALCSEKFMPLMDALSDDVAAQTSREGARILS